MTLTHSHKLLAHSFLALTTQEGMSVTEAAAIYMHCLLSVALDAGRGDRATAAVFIDDVVQRWLTHARAEYAKGGRAEPVLSPTIFRS